MNRNPFDDGMNLMKWHYNEPVDRFFQGLGVSGDDPAEMININPYTMINTFNTSGVQYDLNVFSSYGMYLQTRRYSNDIDQPLPELERTHLREALQLVESVFTLGVFTGDLHFEVCTDHLGKPYFDITGSGHEHWACYIRDRDSWRFERLHPVEAL